jgi:Zn-dependent protease with chaperone function
MPVTVKIEDRAKRDAQKAAGPPAQLDDYVHPGERSEGMKAFALWMLFIVVLVAGFSVAPATRNIGVGIFAWWLLACLGYFFVGPQIVLRRLRVHGNDVIINGKTQPRLKTVLTKGSAILGVAEPEAFLLPEGIPQVRIFGRPTFVLLTQATLDLFQPTEVDVHLLRALIHERQNHTRRLTLLKFLNDTPPAARILVWPVGLYAFFLRMWWTEVAEMTADRLALLLVKNHKLLQSALIKQHAATDPLMQEHEITAQDVDNYIKQAGLIGLQGHEISTQYKLGQAIHENPYLEDRLQQLKDWAESEEFQEAVRKLKEKGKS